VLEKLTCVLRCSGVVVLTELSSIAGCEEEAGDITPGMFLKVLPPPRPLRVVTTFEELAMKFT
jgi:hypothetical protein